METHLPDVYVELRAKGDKYVGGTNKFKHHFLRNRTLLDRGQNRASCKGRLTLCCWKNWRPPRWRVLV
jgi:hypothetical protein